MNEEINTQVFCDECHEWIDIEAVEFVNIEEDLYGRDLMTFVCPICIHTHESNIVRK